ALPRGQLAIIDVAQLRARLIALIVLLVDHRIPLRHTLEEADRDRLQYAIADIADERGEEEDRRDEYGGRDARQHEQAVHYAARRAEAEFRHDRVEHVAHHEHAEHDHQSRDQLRPRPLC